MVPAEGARVVLVAPCALTLILVQGANPASTYESCQTKIYYHGRTECIRAVTDEVGHRIQCSV